MNASPALPRPLIGAAELRTRLSAGWRCVLLDCGFDLADPAAETPECVAAIEARNRSTTAARPSRISSPS